MRSLGWRVIQYLPVLPAVILLSYHVLRVDPFPSQIGVTHRSCSDPANDGRLIFRQQTYCVRPAEAREWETMWRNEYGLIAAFVLCWGISAFARRSQS